MRNVLRIALVSMLAVALCGCVIVPYEEEEESRVSEKKPTGAPAKTRWEK